MRALLVLSVLIWVALTASAPAATAHAYEVTLKLAHLQGHGRASLALGYHYLERGQRSAAITAFQTALARGVGEASEQLAELNPQRADEWLRSGAALGWQPARWAVLKRRFDQDEPFTELLSQTLAEQQLSALSYDERTFLADLLLDAGEPGHLPHWRSVAPTTPRWRRLQEGAELFRRMPVACDVHFLFQLERQRGLRAMYQWAAEMYDRLAQFDVHSCYSRVQEWLPEPCTPDGTRAFCPHTFEFDDHSVNVIVARQGQANTRNRIVYMSESSSWRILFHEMGHALDLADEYPMAGDIAQRFCAGEFRFRALNVVKSRQDLLSQAEFERFEANLPWLGALTRPIGTPMNINGATYWRLGTSEPGGIGLYPAATCERTNYQAWRPVDYTTFMERAETGAVPELYIDLMIPVQ
ncbi:MAG: hypothetical protein JJU10_09555 [Idiomarina sp.]|nr:hypothetical protein [Idiomarina sp.]